MSRLIDKLTKIRQIESQPMGFALGRVTSESSRMQLLAYLSSENVNKLFDSVSSADAILVEITKSDSVATLEKLCRSKNGAPTGGWLKTSASGTLKKALNITCDFIIFPSDTELNVIPKEKVGRILVVEASWSEGLLRTINDLPVEAVLLAGSEAEATLTLNRLMLFQRLIYMVNKPVLVSTPANLTDTELQALWDMGISGIVIQVSDDESAKGLSELHKYIERLAPPAFRKKNRASAILPRPSVEEPKTEENEEEDE